MRRIISYTPETKHLIIAQQKKLGRFLVEVQRHIVPESEPTRYETYLLFDDKPLPPTPKSLEQRITELEAEIANLKATGGADVKPNGT